MSFAEPNEGIESRSEVSICTSGNSNSNSNSSSNNNSRSNRNNNNNDISSCSNDDQADGSARAMCALPEQAPCATRARTDLPAQIRNDVSSDANEALLLPSGHVIDCKNTCRSHSPTPPSVPLCVGDQHGSSHVSGMSVTGSPSEVVPPPFASALVVDTPRDTVSDQPVLVVQALSASEPQVTLESEHVSEQPLVPNVPLHGVDMDAATVSARKDPFRSRMCLGLLAILGAATAVLLMRYGSLETRASNDDTRTKVLVEWINQQTLTGQEIRFAPLGHARQTNEWWTAEEYALQWLVELDPLQLWPTHESANVRLRQRYALATLWFQQSQIAAWNQTNGWLIDDNECSWWGIACRNNASHTAVTHMELAFNNLLGTLSPDLGLLTDLIVFNVNTNRLSGTLPETVGRWTALTHLTLRFNAMSGSLPDTLAQWTQLEQFDAYGCGWTGSIPHSMQHWTRIRHWNAGFNQLTGPLPRGLFEGWPFIETFIGSENAFNGTIPHRITTSRLTLVAWNNTFLSGSLPSTLGRWTRLRDFSVSNARFHGRLPDAMGLWSHLEHVDLSFNRFSGSLPTTFYQWSNLQSVVLDMNQLNGTIPAYMGHSWTNLQVAHLSDNLLTEACRIPWVVGAI